jgi:hypothetical protein
MTTWEVTMNVDGIIRVTVEADSKQDAKEKAAAMTSDFVEVYEAVPVEKED